MSQRDLFKKLILEVGTSKCLFQCFSNVGAPGDHRGNLFAKEDSKVSPLRSPFSSSVVTLTILRNMASGLGLEGT